MRRPSPIALVLLLGSALALGACKNGGAAADAGAVAEGTASPKPAESAGKAADAAGKPAEGGEVTFKKKTPPVGTKVSWRSVTDTQVDMTIEGFRPKPISVNSTMNEVSDRDEEVLAVDGGAVTKVKVTYTAKSTSETAGTKPKKERKSPIAGKTYIVEAKAGDVAVTDANGKPAPAREAKLVKRDFKSIGKPDELQQALPDRPIKVGDKLDSFAGALKERFLASTDTGKSREKIEVNDVNVTLASIGDVGGVKVATFDIGFKAGMSEKKFEMSMDLKGQILVRVDDGWPTELKFEGPISVGGEKKPGDKASISGSGKLAMHLTATYP